MADGINTSRHLRRSQSDYKGHNGHKISDKVHAFQSKDEFIRIAKSLLTYARKHHNIKDFQAINRETIEGFIYQYIENGLYRKTISSYISVLSKIQVVLSKIPKKIEKHEQLFSQKDLKNMRKVVNALCSNSKHKNRAYINPNSLITDIPQGSKICFQLQFNYGLRVSEASLIRPSQLKDNNTIKIQGKSGRIRYIRVSFKLYKSIEKEIKKNGSYHRDYNVYRKDLMNAVEKSGEKWTATHGLRYNFAQQKVEEYMKEMTHEKALLKVSSELGHNRKEITNHYLG